MDLPQAPAVLQLNIRGGEAREEGPYALAQPIKIDGSPAYLFLAAEATGPYPEDVCGLLTATFLTRLAGGRRSLSGRLQAALTAVHNQVLQENTRSIPSQQSSLSAACAVLRPNVIPSGAKHPSTGLSTRPGGGWARSFRGATQPQGELGETELLIATGGPALVLVFSEYGVRNLAAVPSGAAPPLGGSGTAQVPVRRCTLQPGDRVLLLSSDGACPELGSRVSGGSKDALLAAFSAGLEQGMARLYHQAGRLPSFGAVALEQRAVDAVPEDSPGVLDRLEPRRRGILVAQPSTTAGPAPYSYGRAAPGPRKAEHDSEPAAAEPRPRPRPSFLEPHASGVSVPLRNPTLSLRRPGGPPARVLAAAGVLAASIIFAIVLQTAAHERQALSIATTAAQMTRATGFFLQAEAATTGDNRRRLLRDAQREIDAVQKADPDHGDAAALSGRITEELTRLDAVHHLQDVRSLVEPPGGQALYRDLVEQGGNLYLLDKSGDRILQVPIKDASLVPQTSVLYQGRGAAARRNLVALIPMPRGGAWPRDSLLGLDENRGLLELRPGAEPRALPLRGAAEWGSFQAAAGYEGSLYVLDPLANQVWRYVPADSGFDSERRAFLPSVDLRDGVDLAVDGDVYLLLRTGRLLKFSGGRSQPFSLDGLDPPLSGQGSVYAGPGPVLYVSDTANRRLVAFDKAQGRFLRQFPIKDLPAVQALWVDEQNNRIYLATDARVYVATLP